MINCNEATSICDKNQYCEASFFDKVRLGLHNFLCHKCKLYSEQNEVMTKIFKTHLHKTTAAKLCAEDKEELKKSLEKELKSN